MGLSQRRPVGHQHTGAGQARRELASLEGRVGRPQEVGLAVAQLKTAFAQSGCQARPLLLDGLDAALQQLRAAVKRLEGARLRYLRDPEIGLELGKQVLRARAAERVAD